MFKNSKKSVVNSLEEAIVHESGHAKSIYGKSYNEIKGFYEELSKIHLEGISELAYSDGAEALAEIEVLLYRNNAVSKKALSFYTKHMKGR